MIVVNVCLLVQTFNCHTIECLIHDQLEVNP